MENEAFWGVCLESAVADDTALSACDGGIDETCWLQLLADVSFCSRSDDLQCLCLRRKVMFPAPMGSPAFTLPQSTTRPSSMPFSMPLLLHFEVLSKPVTRDATLERRVSMHAFALPLQGSFAKGSIQVLHEASTAPAPWIVHAAPSMHPTLQNNITGVSAPRQSLL